MKKKSFPWMTLALVVVFAGLVFFIGRSVSAGPGTSPNAKDGVVAARSASPPGGGADDQLALPNDASLVGGNGMVEPSQPETKVAGQLSGKIATVLVKEGDRVEKGAPLVTMESTVEKAALDAAEADLSTAKATFARIAHGNRAEDIDAAVAEAASAKAKADNSAEILARTEKLEKEGASTPDELDKAKNMAASDEATAKAAAARAKAATAGSRYEDVAEAKAKVVAAEARRDQAKATLDRLTIVAPIAGEVLRVKYRDGEFYNPASTEPLLILGDTTKLRVRMDVDERDIAKVRMGAKGFVVADAWKGKKFTATVVEIGKRMGRKNVRTDDPVERIDTKILEVVLELDDVQTLVPGQRVMSYVAAN
jgi:HlyD family secretion protein